MTKYEKQREWYVKAKIPHGLLGQIEVFCIPLYKTRIRDDGEIEAEFFLITSDNPERKIQRTENTGEH